MAGLRWVGRGEFSLTLEVEGRWVRDVETGPAVFATNGRFPDLRLQPLMAVEYWYSTFCFIGWWTFPKCSLSIGATARGAYRCRRCHFFACDFYSELFGTGPKKPKKRTMIFPWVDGFIMFYLVIWTSFLGWIQALPSEKVLEYPFIHKLLVFVGLTLPPFSENYVFSMTREKEWTSHTPCRNHSWLEDTDISNLTPSKAKCWTAKILYSLSERKFQTSRASLSRGPA